MKDGYIVFGGSLLTFSAIVIASLGGQALQINMPLGQFGRMFAQNVGVQILLLIGQKLMPMFIVGGAVCLGHGIYAKKTLRNNDKSLEIAQPRPNSANNDYA